MKQNDVITVKIDSLAAGGEGVARHEGMAVFVEEAVPGDELSVRLTQVKKNFSRAKILKIISPSSDRIDPPCKYFHVCGACQLQHIDYGAQLRYKAQIVRDAVQKIAGLDPQIVSEVIPAEKQFGYRNKMQYPVKKAAGGRGPVARGKEEIKIGYFRRGTHDVVDIDECMVLHPGLNRIASAARNALKISKIQIYDEDSGRGVLRHILARTGFATQESILTLIINGRELPGSRYFIKTLLDDLGQSVRLKGVSININTKRSNVILGDRNSVIWGGGAITEKLGQLSFKISPSSFFQVNPLQAQKLYDTAVGLAQLTGDETVLDAYCGTGGIALWFAGRAKEVYGIEEIESAVADAKENAKNNRITNAFFKTGTVESVLRLYREAGMRPDVLVLDPPRAGCSSDVISSALGLRAKKIVYVSCDPATLSRDLRLLSGKYGTVRIQPVDMFPQTSHIECAALLHLKD